MKAQPAATQPVQKESTDRGATAFKPSSVAIVVKGVKYIWVFPVTFMGLWAVGLTAITGGSVKVVDGVVEAGGGFAEWIMRTLLRRKVSCMTVGHVILGLDPDYLARARAHEHVHIEQYEKWGVLFVPLYIGSSLLAWSQGKHRYRDNVFEREAYAKAPCLSAQATRPADEALSLPGNACNTAANAGH